MDRIRGRTRNQTCVIFPPSVKERSRLVSVVLCCSGRAGVSGNCQKKCSHIRDIGTPKSRACPGCKGATAGWTAHAQRQSTAKQAVVREAAVCCRNLKLGFSVHPLEVIVAGEGNMSITVWVNYNRSSAEFISWLMLPRSISQGQKLTQMGEPSHPIPLPISFVHRKPFLWRILSYRLPNNNWLRS